MFGDGAQCVLAGVQLTPDQEGEDGNDEQLKENDETVEVGHKADAAQVDDDHQAVRPDPHPVVDLGNIEVR